MKIISCLLCLGLLLLAACADGQAVTDAILPTPLPSATPSATPDPYQIALGQAQAQATKQALDATSLALSVSMTQTAIAPTLQAEASATAQAWAITSWTATAALDQTATASAWTPTPNFTATVSAAQAEAQATALHGEAVSVELAIERDRMMNKAWAATPWAGLVVALALATVIAWRWSQVRPIQRDARGDAPLLVVDGKIYDADRNPHSLVDLSGPKPSIPALTDPTLQAATTARDQMIDLSARSPRGVTTSRANAALSAPALPPPPTNIKVLPPDQARPLMGDVLPGIVRDAIETDLNGKDEG